MVRIQLVRAPMDDGTLPADRWYLPLDLLAVASAAEGVGGIVTILDGSTRTLGEIANEVGINAEIVGLTYSALSVQSFKYLAQMAHMRGARVVTGGQAATASAESLAAESFIDLVVRGDGEPAIRELVLQMGSNAWTPADIPNGVALVERRLIDGPRVKIRPDEIGAFSRDAGELDTELYVSAFSSGNTLKNIRACRASNIFSKRGCPERCSFCARTDKRIRARQPLQVVNEIAELVERFDLDYIIDTSDTWITSREWIEEFARDIISVTPRVTGMMVFADARHIIGDIAERLASARIDNVLLGIESASERVLRRNGKLCRKGQARLSIETLLSAGISVSVSLVLGLIGEDEESLRETHKFAEWVSGLEGARCYCNVVIPLPGSPCWTEFTAHDAGKKWLRALDYRLDDVRNDFVKSMTNVRGGVARLFDERDKILDGSGLDRLEFAR